MISVLIFGFLHPDNRETWYSNVLVISHRAKLDKCELPALLLVDVAGVVVHVRLVALH